MTKLEAWKAWCATAGTDRLADEFTLENSSHGKAFSFAWDAAHEACAKVCDAKVDAEYATGKVDHNEMGWTQACAIEIRKRGDV